MQLPVAKIWLPLLLDFFRSVGCGRGGSVPPGVFSLSVAESDSTFAGLFCFFFRPENSDGKGWLMERPCRGCCGRLEGPSESDELDPASTSKGLTCCDSGIGVGRTSRSGGLEPGRDGAGGSWPPAREPARLGQGGAILGWTRLLSGLGARQAGKIMQGALEVGTQDSADVAVVHGTVPVAGIISWPPRRSMLSSCSWAGPAWASSCSFLLPRQVTCNL